MIVTSEIAPSPALAPFIYWYAYREFETGGEYIIKPWHASHQSNIVFFLKDVPVKLTDLETGRILKTGKACDVVGISTKCNGEMVFNGSYAFLQIMFKPNGFHKIFNKPPNELMDKIVWSEDVFNADIKLLHEQFFEAGSFAAMAKLADSWLLGYLNKRKRIDYKDRITSTAELISRSMGLVDIDSLADYACMSARNFERAFLYETGMSPKQLCCIARFNYALDLKLKYPRMKWTSIAHQSGYFDQTHLIKDFKRFCGEAPSSLLKHGPLFEEKYMSRINTI
jgi:AraC-like DNA-binding protein